MRISDWSSDVCSSDLFAAFAPDYADLILAGHTHGGQMFPALTGRFVAHQNKLPAARGAMMVNGIPLVITSGVGTSNMPLRVGVPPEIVLLRIGPGRFGRAGRHVQRLNLARQVEIARL